MKVPRANFSSTKIMASRRSPRILTTKIEVCVDPETEEQENKKCDNFKNPSTPIGKRRMRNPSRNAALKQVSQTAPRKRSRQTGNKFEPSKRMESDMWTRAMMEDVSVLQSFVWRLSTVTLTGCPGSIHKGKGETGPNDRSNRTVHHHDS